MRFGKVDLVSYALVSVEELEHNEPKTYMKAISSDDKEHWITTINEEIQSLEKKLDMDSGR